MSRTHFKQSMGESVDSPNFYKCSEPIKPKSKLKTKMDLVEGGDITIKGVITRILLFRVNRGIWSINFTRRSPVRRTYNTEPSPKELAWGRILIFRANRGIWSMNFTRKSPVRRTYNTEPSPKEQAWGRSTPVYPGKYSFPFVLFSFK